MKKLLLMMLVLCTGVSTASAADPSFLGNSAININGNWYYAGQYLDWCSSGAFDNADLGTITTLSLGGQSQAYDNGSDWHSGTVTMGYKIDGGSDKFIDLTYYGFQNSNNYFQSGGSNFSTTDVDLTGLSTGDHTIEIWFRCGSKYDSNDGANYKAKFTIANSYTRSVTTGNFGTICLPFAATVEGAIVFEISGKVMSGETLTGINLESVESLEAGHAYIFKATSSTLTATYSGAYSNAVSANGMTGNLSSSATTVPADADNYVVSGNQIHKVVGGGSGVTIGQYKAYIDMSEVSETNARAANFIGFADDDVTSIESIETVKAQNIVYNLQGQRVKDAKNGLFIVNGKKVVK